MGIEYSQYPKRKGYNDFDLIDLPFPLRKLSVSPLGLLKEDDGIYKIERGVYSYPSVGDIVVIPNQSQLRAIVQNKDKNAKVKIGLSPMAANSPVYVNPDRVFGRHIAILGNTGSGKSCSVAGLLRWSLESAKKEIQENKSLNSRFIILDPNGEYNDAFEGLCTVNRYQVILNKSEEEELEYNQLKVPSWMWNSYEWSSIARASGKTQRPLLRRTLREIKNSINLAADSELKIRIYYSSCLIELKNDLLKGISSFKGKPGKNDFGKKIHSISRDAENDIIHATKEDTKKRLDELSKQLKSIADSKYDTFVTNGKEIEYYNDFDKSDVEKAIDLLNQFLDTVGGFQVYTGPDEDSPIFFQNESFLHHLERLVQEKNAQQFMDFFLMRVRSILTDARIASVIETESKEDITLDKWLGQYIGNNDDNGTINVIDLSLLPSEILYVIVSVLSRIIFEAHQRYRKMTGNILPTTLVVEEAHNFIKRYDTESEDITSNKLCSQIFEKIAKEGRKFGVGLMISSQRPSELSQTVLSQCNSFLLHRIVNDRDQEMVKKLVPDNLGSILNELPILPTKKAILLGWAAPIPLIVEMNTLEEKDRPKSKDPEFWKVWVGEEDRLINWEEIADEWQVKDSEDIQGKEESTKDNQSVSDITDDDVPF